MFGSRATRPLRRTSCRRSRRHSRLRPGRRETIRSPACWHRSSRRRRRAFHTGSTACNSLAAVAPPNITATTRRPIVAGARARAITARPTSITAEERRAGPSAAVIVRSGSRSFRRPECRSPASRLRRRLPPMEPVMHYALKVGLFFVCALAIEPAAASADDGALAGAYQKLVAQAEAGRPVDFRALREAYASSPNYDPYGLKTTGLRGAMLQAFAEHDCGEAGARAKAVIDLDFVQIDAHLVSANAASGRSRKALWFRFWIPAMAGVRKRPSTSWRSMRNMPSSTCSNSIAKCRR